MLFCYSWATSSKLLRILLDIQSPGFIKAYQQNSMSRNENNVLIATTMYSIHGPIHDLMC